MSDSYERETLTMDLSHMDTRLGDVLVRHQICCQTCKFCPQGAITDDDRLYFCHKNQIVTGQPCMEWIDGRENKKVW